MFTESYSLTATEVIAKIQDGELTVEQYATSLLTRIQERDPIVKPWVYINPEQVLAEARKIGRAHV